MGRWSSGHYAAEFPEQASGSYARILFGVPQSILDKAPSAGLWEGQTDEKELGISYEDNSDYLEGKTINPDVQQKLESYYNKTAHKRNTIPGI